MTGTKRIFLPGGRERSNLLQALKGICLPVKSEKKTTKEYVGLMGQRDMLACCMRKKTLLQALKRLGLTVG